MDYLEYDKAVTDKKVTIVEQDAEKLIATVEEDAPVVEVKYRKELLLQDKERLEENIANAEAQIAVIDKILKEMK